jgi:hypothetical protein
MAVQGTLLEFTPKGLAGIPKHSGKAKGTRIKGFSDRSRSRLNRKLATLKKHYVPLFVTLTYHEEHPEGFEGYKYDLKKFREKLLYHYPAAGVIWKMEEQRRGVMHFHLFIWGVELRYMETFVPLAWHKIAGHGSDLHLQWHNGELGNQHCVQQVRSWGGVMSYAAKYMSKEQNTGKENGRVWGCFGTIPYSIIIDFRVDLEQALQFKQWLSTVRGYEFRRLGFWTNDYSADWLNFLWDILYPPDEPEVPTDHDWEPALHEKIFIPLEVNNEKVTG